MCINILRVSVEWCRVPTAFGIDKESAWFRPLSPDFPCACEGLPRPQKATTLAVDECD